MHFGGLFLFLLHKQKVTYWVIFWNAGILTGEDFFAILEAREQNTLENERKETDVKSKKRPYERDLPRRLYTFFAC